jgi:hypothetical protein
MYVMITASGAQTILTTTEVWNLIARLGNPTRCSSHLGGAQYLMHWPDFTVMTTNPRYREVFGLKQGR